MIMINLRKYLPYFCFTLALLYGFTFARSNPNSAVDDVFWEAADKIEILPSVQDSVRKQQGIELPDEAIDIWSRAIEITGRNVGLIGDLMDSQVDAIVSGNGDSLVRNVEKYSNALPPTERDIIIVTSLLDSIRKTRNSYREGADAFIPIHSWGRLVDSKNAIYRYVALYAIWDARPRDYQLDIDFNAALLYEDEETIRRAELEMDEIQFDLLPAFFDEEDRRMRIMVIRSLGSIALPESLDVLHGMRDEYEDSDDLEILSIIDNAISFSQREIQRLNIETNQVTEPKTSDSSETEPVEKQIRPTNSKNETNDVDQQRNVYEGQADEKSSKHVWLIVSMILVCLSYLIIRLRK